MAELVNVQLMLGCKSHLTMTNIHLVRFKCACDKLEDEPAPRLTLLQPTHRAEKPARSTCQS